jgi:ribosomal protein S18 acetylase RimI-like enzyme
MLRPATVVDLPILRALIREGAVAGSLDRDLATESRETTLFYSNLRQALASGYFVEQDPRTGDLTTTAVLGFVYVAEGDISMHRPIGFGIFKALAPGYELWLTGVDVAWRGKGHGRAMLAELLATDPGRKAYVVRVRTGGADSPAADHLLQAFGYARLREMPRFTWYLRNDAPAALREQLRTPAVPHPAG